MQEKYKPLPEKQNGKIEGKPTVTEIKKIRSEIFQNTGKVISLLDSLKEYAKRLSDPSEYRGPYRENVILNIILEREKEERRKEWQDIYDRLRKEGKNFEEIREEKKKFDKETQIIINSKSDHILQQIKESE
jgi:hypothetical protein